MEVYKGLICQRHENVHEYIRLLHRPLTDLERRAFMHFLDIETSDAAKWQTLYDDAKDSEEDFTFVDLERTFGIENGYSPNRDLPLMPKSAIDWFRPVKKVRRGKLFPLRPDRDVKIEHMDDCMCHELIIDIVKAIDHAQVDCLVAKRNLDGVPGTPSERYRNDNVPFMQGVVVSSRIKAEHANELMVQAQEMLSGFLLLFEELAARHMQLGYKCHGAMIREAFPQLLNMCLEAKKKAKGSSGRTHKEKSAARVAIESALTQWTDIESLESSVGIPRRQIKAILKTKDFRPSLDTRLNETTGRTEYVLKTPT